VFCTSGYLGPIMCLRSPRLSFVYLDTLPATAFLPFYLDTPQANLVLAVNVPVLFLYICAVWENCIDAQVSKVINC
jgi:hypothetical protein